MESGWVFRVESKFPFRDSRVSSESSGISESGFSGFPVWADSGFFGTVAGLKLQGSAGDSAAPGHRKPKGQPDQPNRVLQGKSPPSSLSGIRGSAWAGFPLNAVVRRFKK
jgi:hypothetical protein